MNTLKFKTNINCAGCLAKVSPFLNAEQSIEKWEVDTSIPEKILTVETDETNADRVDRKSTRLNSSHEKV